MLVDYIWLLCYW